MNGRQILMVATFVGVPVLIVGLAWCRVRIIERAAMSTDGEGTNDGR